MEVADHMEINIKRDNTIKKERYYCVLGVSKRKVIYGSSVDIVYKKCQKAIEKGEVSFEPYPVIVNYDDDEEDDIPF